MIKFILYIAISSSILLSQDFSNPKYQEIAKKIYDYAHKDSSAWDKLAYMCDTYGNRISGSENLEKAIDWIHSEMQKDGFENVKKEPVMVPKWVRGHEECTMTAPWVYNIPMLSIGQSVPTAKNGIEAELIIVKDFDELDKLGKKVKGKIVLFNRPFTNYGETVQYRFNGASRAAEYGAVAMLLRSVTPHYDANAHTGTSFYKENIKKIPQAAISLEATDLLQRLINKGEKVTIQLKIDTKHFPESQSHNVMCELKGTTLPNEIVAAGGHIDSWDVGQGAHDDGGPCIAVWQAVKLLKELNLVPKRTLRVVLWTNEENGLKGGTDYADKHKNEPHHGLLEFDSGVFKPAGIGYSGNEKYFAKFKESEHLFKIINDEFYIKQGGGGADIGPMMNLGFTGMGFNVNSNNEYWRYHHSHNDTVDKVDKKVLNDCIAALALSLYIYADLDIIE